MISILHPSRGRPHKSYATIKKWIERSGVSDLELILSFDSDDPCLDTYKKTYEHLYDVSNYCTMIEAPNKNAIQAINLAAERANRNVFIVVSDDTDCPMHWGKRLLHAIGKEKDFVMKVDDGVQKRIITMPILDRHYYARDNFIFNPIYDHLFADTEFTEVAIKRKRYIKRMGLKFPHDHYSRNGGTPDTTAIKNELTYAKGKRIYQERKSINFGL